MKPEFLTADQFSSDLSEVETVKRFNCERFSSSLATTHPKSPEGLDDVRGDGGSSLVGVGLPRQRHAVLGHVCDDGFVRRTWQLEGLRGLGHRRVCAL